MAAHSDGKGAVWLLRQAQHHSLTRQHLSLRCEVRLRLIIIRMCGGHCTSLWVYYELEMFPRLQHMC